MALLLSLIAFTCMYATSPDLNRNKSGGMQVVMFGRFLEKQLKNDVQFLSKCDCLFHTLFVGTQD